jgi:hypothetical protein
MRHLPLIFLQLTLLSCVSAPVPVEKNYERKFRASFDEVWRACQQAIISYPLKVNNMEQGAIQTTMLRSHTYFRPPHIAKKHASGYRYTLHFNLIKNSDKETTLSIHKKLLVYRDFISKPEDLISDGLEESILLYRIQREIEIDRQILKVTKSKAN